jgi:hypothetical protein
MKVATGAVAALLQRYTVRPLIGLFVAVVHGGIVLGAMAFGGCTPRPELRSVASGDTVTNCQQMTDYYNNQGQPMACADLTADPDDCHGGENPGTVTQVGSSPQCCCRPQPCTGQTRCAVGERCVTIGRQLADGGQTTYRTCWSCSQNVKSTCYEVSSLGSECLTSQGSAVYNLGNGDGGFVEVMCCCPSLPSPRPSPEPEVA